MAPSSAIVDSIHIKPTRPQRRAASKPAPVIDSDTEPENDASGPTSNSFKAPTPDASTIKAGFEQAKTVDHAMSELLPDSKTAKDKREKEDWDHDPRVRIERVTIWPSSAQGRVWVNGFVIYVPVAMLQQKCPGKLRDFVGLESQIDGETSDKKRKLT